MVLVWRSYQSDLGRAYPMLPIAIANLSDIATEIDVVNDILPSAIAIGAIDVKHPCSVSGLTSRKLVLWLSDGAQIAISYPQPFDVAIANRLNALTVVVAWEFIGERLKHGRLKRILDNAL